MGHIVEYQHQYYIIRQRKAGNMRKHKQKALLRLLSVTLFISLSMGMVSCMKSNSSAETKEKTKQFTVRIDDAQLELGKALSNPNGIDQKAVDSALAKIQAARLAYDELKDSGASWYDIGQGALGGIMGRTAVHALRAAVMAYFTGPLGVIVSSGLGMLLGGSGTARKEEDELDLTTQ